MFTLIYNNGHFNKPDTLLPFLQFNIGEYPLLQVDCITPYKGKEADLVRDVCEYLSKAESTIIVMYNMTQNASTESNSNGFFVNYLVIQIHVEENYHTAVKQQI